MATKNVNFIQMSWKAERFYFNKELCDIFAFIDLKFETK